VILCRAGAEWWWQDLDYMDPPKVYHTDCNVWMEDGQAALEQHPAWSSVLYLCSAGGATSVFAGDEAIAVFPWPGRYLMFPGDRVHGVLHAKEQEHADRITFLVNYWPYRPPGLSNTPVLPRALQGWQEETTLPGGSVPIQTLQGHPIKFIFADHVDQWRGQRLPEDLEPPIHVPPVHVAALYSASVSDPNWWKD